MKLLEIEKKIPGDLKQESIFLHASPSHLLHLKHFWAREGGPICFLLHGSIENGKIFYTSYGKGLAPFLARQGFDVFVGDLRGRGLSTPKINCKATYGQREAINEDIPKMLNKIKTLRGVNPHHWISHSWGGVLLLSALAKQPILSNELKSLVFFSTKRIISVSNWQKKLKLDFGWHIVGKQLINLFGYLPAQKLGIGSDNETRYSFKQCNQWLKPSSLWIDSSQQFDYGNALKNIKLPPILSLTGSADHYLGHPKDVFAFLEEIQTRKYEFHVLGKQNGQMHDYDHINILTHKDAPEDQFLMVKTFLNKYS